MGCQLVVEPEPLGDSVEAFRCSRGIAQPWIATLDVIEPALGRSYDWTPPRTAPQYFGADHYPADWVEAGFFRHRG